MIKFFRKIRQNLIQEGKIANYFKYAIGEIVLVMIGILLALQVNNWNEKRKTKNLETDILKEIRTGLKSDLNDIQGNLNTHKELLKSENIIIKWLESDLVYNDSLSPHFSKIYIGTFFSTNDVAYQTLKQLGMRTVSNDSLRNKISTVYDISYHRYLTMDAFFDKQLEFMFEDNPKFFNEWAFKEAIMKPIDIKGLKTSNEYLYHLKSVRNLNEVLLQHIFPNTIAEISKTLSLIDKELKDK